MPEDVLELDAATGAAGTADAAAQPTEPSEPAADPMGATAATPTETTTQPLTSDTGESPESLLARAVPGVQPARPAAPAAPAAPAIPPELQQLLQNPEEVKRLTNLNRLYGQQSQELGQLRKAVQGYQGLPSPDQMRQMLDNQQKQAQLAQRKPWDPRHPDSAHTQQRMAAARNWRAAVDAAQADPTLTDEQRQRLAGSLAKQLRISKEDLAILDQFEDHRAQMVDRQATDPEGLFDELFEARFAAKMAEYEQKQQHTQAAQQFLQSHQELLGKYTPVMQWAMDNPARREVAVRLAQLEAENEELRKKTQADTEVVETAKARDQVTKSRATVKRDAATNDGTIGNVLDTAKRENWDNQKLLKSLMKARGIDE